MINEEYVATLDYLVAASLWASITNGRDQAKYYLLHVNYYKHLDRQEGKPNWWDDLYKCLHEWQSRFPQVVRCQKSTLTEIVMAAAAGGAAAIPAFLAGWF